MFVVIDIAASRVASATTQTRGGSAGRVRIDLATLLAVRGDHALHAYAAELPQLVEV
ncbi:MAG: hypothetical protein U0572_01830 [Phycisphaerales bacterium]